MVILFICMYIYIFMHIHVYKFFQVACQCRGLSYSLDLRRGYEASLLLVSHGPCLSPKSRSESFAAVRDSSVPLSPSFTQHRRNEQQPSRSVWERLTQ